MNFTSSTELEGFRFYCTLIDKRVVMMPEWLLLLFGRKYCDGQPPPTVEVAYMYFREHEYIRNPNAYSGKTRHYSKRRG